MIVFSGELISSVAARFMTEASCRHLGLQNFLGLILKALGLKPFRQIGREDEGRRNLEHAPERFNFKKFPDRQLFE